MGLDACTGRIVCIGVYWLEKDRSRAYCQSEERELLANFWSDLVQIRPTRFVTFNGKSFDFPYINVRSAILNVPAPRDLLLDTRRFATDRHFDVREALTNYDRYRKGTLEFFARYLGCLLLRRESTAARSESTSSRAVSTRSPNIAWQTAKPPRRSTSECVPTIDSSTWDKPRFGPTTNVNLRNPDKDNLTGTRRQT